MELSDRLQIQRSPDGSWYLTVTLKGFRNLGDVEGFIKKLPKLVLQATGQKLLEEGDE